MPLNYSFAPRPFADLPTDRFGIGEGYNSFTNEMAQQCVEYNRNDNEELYSDTGQTVQYQMEEITSLESLKRYTGVSASASFGWGPFQTDGSYGFLSSGNFTGYSNYLFLRVTVNNSTQKLRILRLTPEALEHAHVGREADFLRFCGDEFVYGKRTGGDFIAIVRFISNSADEQREVSGAVQASVTGFGGAAVQMNERLNSLSRFTKVSVYVLRSGGVGAIPDINGLREAAVNFPTQVANGAAPLTTSLLTRSYENATNFPRDINMDTVRNAALNLSELSRRLDKVYEIRGNLTYIIEHSSEFNNGSLDLNALRSDLNRNEQTINAIIASGENRRSELRRARVCSLPSLPEFINIAVTRTPPRREPRFDWVGEFTEVFSRTAPICPSQLNRCRSRGLDESGTFSIPSNIPQAKIYKVEYRCNGNTCGWRYNPDGGYDAKYEVLADGRSFKWYRRYQSAERDTEIYIAYYKKWQCVENCPN